MVLTHKSPYQSHVSPANAVAVATSLVIRVYMVIIPFRNARVTHYGDQLPGCSKEDVPGLGPWQSGQNPQINLHHVIR